MLSIPQQVKIPAAIEQIFFPVKFHFDIVLIQTGIQFSNFLENLYNFWFWKLFKNNILFTTIKNYTSTTTLYN